MRVLITGHRGFIGQHLVPELTDAGHEVAGVDIASTRTYDGIESNVGFDLTKQGAVAAALDGYRPEVVIHLAAQVGRVLGEDDVRYTVRENAEMTTVLARASAERPVRVLYASTSEVYGDQAGLTCTETGRMVLPYNLYGLSKRWGEEALRLYAPQGLQIVRLSMPYGPGAPPGRGRRALDNILHQAHHGLPIPIHHGAERSWCWVGDTVRAIRMVMEEGEQHVRHASTSLGVYNVGRDDVPISMLDLAHKCCVLAEADDELIEVIPAPTGQTVVKRLSTTKLHQLGWMPTVEMDEGLPQVLEWVQRFDALGLPLRACASCGGPLVAQDAAGVPIDACPIHGEAS